mmetsp:Transcript_37030/g.85592  ORF Transcript_37030/g.85592 Transcript_37030/m.85592 type:complete len:169 (+) Transcript_37030:58-564(+)
MAMSLDLLSSSEKVSTNSGALHGGCLQRDHSFASMQTVSNGTDSSSPEPSSDGSHPRRAATWQSSTRDYKRKMLVKAFLQANGFLHVNEAKHSWGRTRYPLHVAVLQNKPTVVKALLLLGARRKVQTRRGFSPEDLARRGGLEEVLKILETTEWDDSVCNAATLCGTV